MAFPVAIQNRNVTAAQLASTVTDDLRPWQETAATVNYTVHQERFAAPEQPERHYSIWNFCRRPKPVENNPDSSEGSKSVSNATGCAIQRLAELARALQNTINSRCSGTFDVSVFLENQEVAHFKYQWDTRGDSR